MSCKGCQKRAEASRIKNPLIYWGLWVPSRFLRGLARRANGTIDERLLQAEGHLTAVVKRLDGTREYLDLGKNTITDAAVAFMVDDFDTGATDITDMKWHAMGTGACGGVAPICGRTALFTESAENRVSGTKSQPAANQYRCVGEITATGVRTITEWGLFSANAAGTAWSMRCFSGASIGLTSGDSIEFTYTLTIACVVA